MCLAAMVDGAEEVHPVSLISTSMGTPKVRSLSDTPPMLSPSPKFREPVKSSSKDDLSLGSTTAPSQRPSLTGRGLSLQMPLNSKSGPNVLNPLKPVPLSPKLDISHTYGSPASVLPRRSRGLDFSRACTNLHHSTLAEQSSPDSSPTFTGRATMIPHRKGFHNPWITQGSPSHHAQGLWSAANNMERFGMAGSIGSVNMLEFDSDGSSSDDQDEIMDAPDYDDPILSTPQVHKLLPADVSIKPTGISAQAKTASSGGDRMGHYSPATRSLLSFRRARPARKGGRKESSSASASGSSSMPSPGPASPAAMKGVEGSQGYFAKDWPSNEDHPRRRSLTMGTKDLQLSSGGESDEGVMAISGATRNRSNKIAVNSGAVEEKRGVIKRAVTRRGNLLPKTKNFARIQAALMEEGAPVDSEVKREAEVVRQVRESDPDFFGIQQSPRALHSTSPMILPSVPGPHDPLENMSEDSSMSGMDKIQSHSFTLQAKRLSGGKEFWDNFDVPTRTPQPPFFPRAGSLAVSDDVNMDSPVVATPISTPNQQVQEASLKSSRSSQSAAPQPSAEELSQKIRKKRARDDDFDPMSFKRRAVSPGVSVQNSPTLAESPIQKDGGWWGLPISHRDSSTGPNGRRAAGERTNSVASSASGSVKRVGLQGMVDTNDGLQKMSIE